MSKQVFHLEGISKEKKIRPLKILIYGPNGVGKSTFCARSLHPIFLDLEGNVDHLDVPRQAVNNYEEVFGFLDFLLKEEHPFKTLVVDSLESLEQLFWAQVEKENNVTSLGKIPFGGGYMQALELFKYFRETLSLLHQEREMNICLIGHEALKTVNTPNLESFDRIEVRIQGKAAGLLMDWCTAVIYATRDVVIHKEKGAFQQEHKKARDIQRILYTDGNASFIAKNIYNLPLVMPLQWQTFKDHVEQFYQA